VTLSRLLMFPVPFSSHARAAAGPAPESAHAAMRRKFNIDDANAQGLPRGGVGSLKDERLDGLVGLFRECRKVSSWSVLRLFHP
jgi:hypothetical protein